jgi:tetratricopeptide (TPR) repeat protein
MESEMQNIVDRLIAARDAARQGRFEEARTLASEVLAAQPNALVALRTRAWAELELGLQAAQASFQACRTADPLDPLAEIGLGLMAASEGDEPTALQHFCRAYELGANEQRERLEIKRLGGELPETRLAEGIALIQEGQNENAAELLRAASAAAPNDAAPKVALAHALWHVGAREQVTNLCGSVISAYPNCLEALIYTMAAELAMGRTLRTREMLSRVEAVDPGHLLSAELLEETGVSRAIQGMRRSGSLTAALGQRSS